MKALSLYLLLQVFSLSAFSAVPLKFSGENILSKESHSISAESDKRKALIVVFLSAKCPCSDSHIVELKNLSEKHKDFEFIGIHSNTDEPEALSKKYFAEAKLPFPVIQDPQAKLADEFKAYKTPHVFVLNNHGEVLYQGGVSDSKKFDKSDQKFLREALADIEGHREIKTPFGRTLGCAISRGDQHVW